MTSIHDAVLKKIEYDANIEAKEGYGNVINKLYFDFLLDKKDEFINLNPEDIITFIRDLNEDRKITDTEIIFYYSAIEFLKENDPSLMDSIAILSDLGYSIDSGINSELLASALVCDMSLNSFLSYLEELEAFIKELIYNQ